MIPELRSALFWHLSTRATGALRSPCKSKVGADAPPAAIYLRRGYVVGVAAPTSTVRLGDLLRADGTVTEEEAERGHARARAESGPGGRALVALGAAQPGDVERALKRQTELRLDDVAAHAAGPVVFDVGAQPPAQLAIPPLAPWRWLRERVRPLLDDEARPHIRALLLRGQLEIRPKPPGAMLEPGDRAILDRLLAGESSQLGADPAAVELFAIFDACGALELKLGEDLDAREILGVRHGADRTEIKSAYHRLARSLHPDAHPGASARERARFSARFAAATAAYRQLVR